MDVHHIVPLQSKEASGARRVLQKFKIDLDAIENGVALPRSSNYLLLIRRANPDARAFHAATYGKNYALAINALLRDATSREDVLARLAGIKNGLLHGYVPRPRG